MEQPAVGERSFTKERATLNVGRAFGLIERTIEFIAGLVRLQVGTKDSIVADIPNGLWTHVACVKAGNKWRCYVNGVLTRNSTSGGTVGNTGPTYIGDDPWYTGSKVWIDDVRMYNTAVFSVGEVKSLYGQVGYWKLDEASGTTAADATNAGNTGTYTMGRC